MLTCLLLHLSRLVRQLGLKVFSVLFYSRTYFQIVWSRLSIFKLESSPAQGCPRCLRFSLIAASKNCMYLFGSSLYSQHCTVQYFSIFGLFISSRIFFKIVKSSWRKMCMNVLNCPRKYTEKLESSSHFTRVY